MGRMGPVAGAIRYLLRSNAALNLAWRRPTLMFDRAGNRVAVTTSPL
jgi:hypothetical protein